MTELTPRHKEILVLMADGLTSREIAVKLGMTLAAVEGQRRTIMERLDALNMAQMIVKACKMGLI